MATAPIETVIEYLRPILAHEGAGRTDAQLLGAFIDHKDEIAFEALVRRHGAMVLNVCRRVVRNLQDAEDAFQATFLVLARKGASVRPREMVANWLHGVAYRTSLKARTMTAKRQSREKQVTELPEMEVPPQEQMGDVLPILDEELSRLPAHYRLPILLCDLECKSIKDATQQLGWPQGTLAGRLVRARKILAKRLTRRGVVLTGATLVFPELVASAGVPSSLMISTVKAAAQMAAGQATVAGVVPAKVAALMQGVTQAMLLTKIKSLAAVVLALGIVAFGGGMLAIHHAAGQQKAPDAANQPLAADDQASQNPKIDPKPATDGDSKTEIATLRTDVAKLRLELEAAVKEINGLKATLREAAPKDQSALYRGKPASFWLEQFKDADPKFRVEAVQAIAKLAQKNKELIPVLVAALKDTDEEVGLEAVRAVGNMGPEVVPPLLDVLKDNTSLEGLYHGSHAAGRLGTKAKAAIPLLAEILKVEDRAVRSNTASALQRMGPEAKSAIPAIVEALGASLADEEKTKIESKRIRFTNIGRSYFQNQIINALLAIDPEVKSILPVELLPHEGGGRGLPSGFESSGSKKDQTDYAALWQQAHTALKKKYEKQK